MESISGHGDQLSQITRPQSTIYIAHFKETQSSREFNQSCKNLHYGSTTLIFRYAKGIIVAMNSPAGDGISNIQKIYPINKFAMGIVVGGKEDCVKWAAAVVEENRLNEMRVQQRLSINSMAKIIYDITKLQPDAHMRMIMCGFDRDTEYKIFAVSESGKRRIDKIITVGSGSKTISDIMDKDYLWEMDEKAAISLAQRCIFYAGFNSGTYTGGLINIFHIGMEGWTSVMEIHGSKLVDMYEGKNN